MFYIKKNDRSKIDPLKRNEYSKIANNSVIKNRCEDEISKSFLFINLLSQWMKEISNNTLQNFLL